MYVVINTIGILDENVLGADSRNAFQVLYALSRYYEVCHVEKNTITWTCDTHDQIDNW